MINHSNLTKLLLMATLLINGCSSIMNDIGFDTNKRKDYSLDPLTNRRSPDHNPDNDPITQTKKPDMIADDDNQNAYENYQGNLSYESIQTAKKNKMSSTMNARKLNQSMDKIGDTQTQAKSTAKPEITAESNLNQIITYNKQQQAKTTSTSTNKRNKPKVTKDNSIKTSVIKPEKPKLTMPPVSPPPAQNASQDSSVTTAITITPEGSKPITSTVSPPAKNTAQDSSVITPATTATEKPKPITSTVPPLQTSNPSKDTTPNLSPEDLYIMFDIK